MNLFVRLFDPLRRACAAFFKHDIALTRADDGVRIVLRSRAAPPPPGKEVLQERREKQELTLMLAQLAELLNELPETRHTMRHLVFLEQALEKKGLRALHKLPLDVVQRALEQLEGLVTNWSPVGLAALRSKMAVTIIDREHQDPDAEADAYRTAAVLDHGPSDGPPVEVVERTDDEALAAAYAALGTLAPAAAPVEVQGDLDSPSARAVTRDAMRPVDRAPTQPGEIRLRELQH
jgi:hypothetical protein